MLLTSDDLWRMARLAPALASGLVAAALGFLLARKNGSSLYRAFAAMLISFLAYGVADFLTRESWQRTGWHTPTTRLFGAADILSLAWMVKTLACFTAEILAEKSPGLPPRVLNLPLFAASVAVVLLFVPGVPWTEPAFGVTGLTFLMILLVAVALCAARLLVHDRRILDRDLRTWARSVGLLLLVFLPLWVLEALRVVQWGGFAWFFLLFNLAGLATIVQAHFRPVAWLGDEGLFAPEALARVATRFGWTTREAEVAALHARGLPSAEIAARLFVAPKTVRNHVANLYSKAGVHQRMALVELLFRG